MRWPPLPECFHSHVLTDGLTVNPQSFRNRHRAEPPGLQILDHLNSLHLQHLPGPLSSQVTG
ncbi:Peptidoglycan glycosyltransferase [Alicyclobacillus hesperidum URH17-3-68]|nr:Peptidoglycan glycosyltransferase [Alicyclobacillus hesperidum URH17-3-68]